MEISSRLKANWVWIKKSFACEAGLFDAENEGKLFFAKINVNFERFTVRI
jgi:hypothetical protein